MRKRSASDRARSFPIALLMPAAFLPSVWSDEQPMEIGSFLANLEETTQREFLLRFLDSIDLENTSASILSHEDHYEIIVVHPGRPGKLTGGAEQYLVDKASGEWRMG